MTDWLQNSAENTIKPALGIRNRLSRMDYTAVLQNVSKHIRLDPPEEKYFTSLLEEKKVRKKEFLLVAGQPCTAISYVCDGTLRAYYRDRDDNESIIMFAVHDWWITDMHSFLAEKPALLNIDAVEDSNVLELKKADLDRLYLEVPKFERFFRVIMQNAYVREQLRVIENLSMPAGERYENFLKKYPQFAHRVPLKQIASYLGITPEFLSVLRKNRST